MSYRMFAIAVLCVLLIGCKSSPKPRPVGVEEESDEAYMARDKPEMDKWWAEAQERARKNPPKPEPEPKLTGPAADLNGRNNYVYLVSSAMKSKLCNVSVSLEGDKSDVLVVEGIFSDPWGEGVSHIYQNCIEDEIITCKECRHLMRELKFKRLDIVDDVSGRHVRFDVRTWTVIN